MKTDEQIIEAFDFDEAIDEIRALREHDEALYRFGRENAGKICRISARYVCLCGNPEWLEFEIGEASDAFQTRRVGPIACPKCNRRYVLTAYVTDLDE